VLFVIALSTMMLPFHILIIPRFIMFKSFGWLDTFYPLIVPQLFAGAMHLFLMRQFLMSIPIELDEASKIDGCNYLQTFLKIIMPLSKPVLGIVSVFTFLSSWKDFMGPLIYLSSQKNYTLALGLNALRNDYFVEWNLMMAATTLVMIPPVIVFFIAQKYFIQGVVFTGIKG
jgi:ABC-type glycerol-3-phosphate transport system permease component